MSDETFPGDQDLVGAILARTSGPACGRAQSSLCARIDGELDPLDAALVDGHVAHCRECDALARALRSLAGDLPQLATADPGPGFVDAVLARTSRSARRRPVPGAGSWAAWASKLLDRPRIALEGAFVIAVIVGVPLASQPATFTELPADVLADARGTMNDIEATVQVRARTAWASTHAFVNSTSTRLRQGTFARTGASEQQGAQAAQEKKP